ncbi:DUF3007 family protein [Tolypothrix campylonemoides VB511288]|nr:DUF3007 family protein [Tolypothrix campylonemoides VB511288]
MRRIDAIGIGLGIFVAGGSAYVLLRLVGIDNLEAGTWSQVLLFVGLIGWLLSYALRAVRKKMTYHQQREQYEQAYFQKRLEDLTPEELAKIQAEIEQEKQLGNRE